MPALPGLSAQQQKAIEASMKSISAIGSPYRVFVGDEARALLRQMVGGEKVIWRVIGVNAAASTTGTTGTTGTIQIKADLAKSLAECGINLD